MARKIPFSYNFPLLTGFSGSEPFSLGSGRSLRSLTVYVEEDNLGPVLVDIHILVENFKHQIGQPTAIYDGEGHNAKRLQWQGELPMSRVIENKLILNWANYCGDDVTVRITGVKER